MYGRAVGLVARRRGLAISKSHGIKKTYVYAWAGVALVAVTRF